MGRLQLAARGENVLFLPQNLDIWGQKSFFCSVIAIFVDGANDHYTRGYNFPIGTTPKKISVSELGVIFWGSPLFLAIPTLEGQLPLILVRFQRNLGESSGPSKNDPEGQRTRSGPELRRNGRFYVRPKSVFWPKNGSYPKKSPKMTFSPLIIWAKGLFFFEQLFPVGANLSPTDQCFQHEKGVSLESRYEGTKIFTPFPQKIGFWAQKRPNLAQNWHFGPNIGIFGPSDLRSDQKTMRTSCLDSFLLCWYQNFYLLP